jgi:hypothetical protein
MLMFLALLLLFMPMHIIIRSDQLLLLLVCVTLFSGLRLSHNGFIIVLGLITAVAINLKINGVLYFIPFVFLNEKIIPDIKSLISGSVLFIIFLLLPFIHPGISLTHYFNVLRSTSETGVVVSQVFKNVEWVLFLNSPFFILMLLNKIKFHKKIQFNLSIFTIAVFVCSLVSAFLGAKKGSFYNFLLPLIPLYVYIFYQYYVQLHEVLQVSSPDNVRLVYLVLFVFLFASTINHVPKFINVVYAVNRAPYESIIEDLDAVSEQYTNTIVIGHGHYSTNHPYERYDLSQFGNYLISEGNPLFIYARQIIEVVRMKRQVPVQTSDYLASGAVSWFLYPRGSTPLMLYYEKVRTNIYPESLIKTFNDNYRYYTNSQYFDIYMYVGN